MTKQQALLTLAIPTYNRAGYLDRQLSWAAASIGEQWDGCELIVSDNASTDSTPEVCAKWKARLGDHLTVYRQGTNIGSGLNFCFCLQHAKGSYVWLIGDDDVIYPKAVLAVLGILRQSSDLGVVLLNFRTTDNYGGPVIASQVYPCTETMWAFPGKDLFLRCLQQNENAMLLITAGIVRTTLAVESIAYWPRVHQNTALATYIRGYAAIRSGMALTADTFLDYPLGSGNLSRWLVTVFYHIPEVYLRLIKLGFDAPHLRRLILDRAAFLTFMWRFPLDFARSLGVYLQVARMREWSSDSKTGSEPPMSNLSQ